MQNTPTYGNSKSEMNSLSVLSRNCICGPLIDWEGTFLCLRPHNQRMRPAALRACTSTALCICGYSCSQATHAKPARRPMPKPLSSRTGLSTRSGLNGSYPNPFNATTVITYELPTTAHVKLEVYNISGQKVATLVNGKQQAGYRSVTWDASKVSSGLYFYKLTAGDFAETKRMMLVK